MSEMEVGNGKSKSSWQLKNENWKPRVLVASLIKGKRELQSSDELQPL